MATRTDADTYHDLCFASVAFPRVEFAAVINYTLRTRLKFVYCSINEAHGENWKYIDTRYARKYN